MEDATRPAAGVGVGEPPTLFRKRSTLPTNTSFAIAHTILHSAAEAAEAAATQRAQEAEARAKARSIRANCPALEKAMKTLAKPFDPKAKRTKQVAPDDSNNGLSLDLGKGSSHASVPLGSPHSAGPDTQSDFILVPSKRSSMPSGGLRGLLEQKERELGLRHVTISEPAENRSREQSGGSREHSRSRGSSRERSLSRPGSLTSSSPPTSAQSLGLQEFKHTLRSLLSTTQHERDKDVDALLSARGNPKHHAATKQARVELEDLIQMEKELDEEFGPLRGAAEPNGRSYIRSTPSSAQHSRRGSFTVSEFPSSSITAASTSPPQSSSTLGSKVRDTNNARRTLDNIGLARQKSVENGTGVRGISAQASANGGLVSTDHLPAHVPRPNLQHSPFVSADGGASTSRSTSRPGSSLGHHAPPAPNLSRPSSVAPASVSRRSSLTLSQPNSAAPSPTPFLPPQQQRKQQEEKQESASPRSTASTLPNPVPSHPPPRSKSPLPLSRSPPTAHKLLQAIVSQSQSQSQTTASQAPAARGLKDVMGGRFVFARPSTAKPAGSTVPPIPIQTAREPSPSNHNGRPSTASAQATSSRLYSATTASSAAKKQPAIAREEIVPQAAVCNAPLQRPQTAITTQRAPSPSLNGAPTSSTPLTPLTSSPLLRSRKLSDEELSDEESERSLILQAVELEAAERATRLRRRRSSLPEEMLRMTSMLMQEDHSPSSAESLPSPSNSNAPRPPMLLKASSHSVTSSRTASPSFSSRPLTAGLRKSISSSEAEGMTAVLHPTPPAPFKPQPPQTLSASNSVASVGSVESNGSTNKGGKIKLAPLTASASSLPSVHSSCSDEDENSDDADEVRSNDGRDDVVPTARDQARAKIKTPATIKSPTSRRSKSQKALSQSINPASPRPRSSHHVVPSKIASSGASVASTSSASSSLSAASQRLRSSVLASLHSGKYSNLVHQTATMDLAAAEERLAQLGKEYNKLRHLGETKAGEVVARTKDLTQLVDRSTVDTAELKHLNSTLIEKESEWTDLLSQQNQVSSENETLSVEIRATEAKRARDEKRLHGFRELSEQLDTKITVASRKLLEIREETTSLESEMPRLRQQLSEQADAYEKQLDQQRIHVQTLELLRRQRERGTLTEDSPIADGSSSPLSKQDHLLRLWTARMEHIASTTGVSDFLDFLQRIEDHPSAKVKAEADRATQQIRLDRLKQEQMTLAKLLGMTRMATRNATRQPIVPANQPDVSLPSLVDQAMERLESIQVQLTGTRSSPLAATPESASKLLQSIEVTAVDAAI